MSSKFRIFNKSLEQKNMKTLNKNLKILSPINHPILSIKRISIDCNALNNNINKDSKIFFKTLTLKKKSLSKAKQNKAYSNKYLDRCNPFNKITINCLDENPKKEKEKEKENDIMKNKIHHEIKSNDALPELNLKMKENYFNNQYKRTEQHSNSIKVTQNKGFINEIKSHINNKSKIPYIFYSNKKENKPTIILSSNKNHKMTFTSFKGEKENKLNLNDFDKIENSNSSEDKEQNIDKSEENSVGDDNNSSIHSSSDIEEDDDKLIIKSKLNMNNRKISSELNENKESRKENKENIENNQNQGKENIVKDNNKINEQKKFIKQRKKAYSYTFQSNQINFLNKKYIISSAITKAGICDEEEKINQDSYLIKENIFNEDLNLYGIFDGHGQNGHLVSKYISKYVNNYYSNKSNYINNNDNNDDSSLLNNIKKLFEEKNEKIIKQCQNNLDLDINSVNFDIMNSGSTSVLLFLTNEQLICSNIGDSECYLFNCSNEDMWSFESLAKVHKPTDEDEKKRILENGGEVHPYYEEDGIFEGPDRIYEKGKSYPGLSLSRSIGDLDGKRIGIISEPDIITKNINENCKFIVMGSDGLWDAIQPYDVSRILRSYFNKGDIDGACKILLKKAELIWKKRNEERDDITIIVIFIGKPNIQLQKEKNVLYNEIKENESEETSRNESTSQTPFLLKLD